MVKAKIIRNFVRLAIFLEQATIIVFWHYLISWNLCRIYFWESLQHEFSTGSVNGPSITGQELYLSQSSQEITVNSVMLPWDRWQLAKEYHLTSTAWLSMKRKRAHFNLWASFLSDSLLFHRFSFPLWNCRHKFHKIFKIKLLCFQKHKIDVTPAG